MMILAEENERNTATS